jgi:hypothetical protein
VSHFGLCVSTFVCKCTDVHPVAVLTADGLEISFLFISACYKARKNV